MTESSSPEELNARFLSALETIRSALEKLYGDQFKGVGQALNVARQKGHPVANRNRELLTLFVDMRNSMVHSITGTPVATPRVEALEALENLADKFANPRRVREYMTNDPTVLAPTDRLQAALLHVIAHDLSQIPVYEGDRCVGLLTTNMIARWLSSAIINEGGFLADGEDEPRVETLLGFKEVQDAVACAGPNLAASEACRRLCSECAPAALLITDTGHSSGRPMGIVTRADVPRMINDMRVSFPA